MKKNIIYCLLFINIVLFNKAFAESNEENVCLLRPIHIHIEFDIATRRSGCENGLGICRWEGGGGRSSNIRTAYAECYIENETFTILINGEKMSNGLLEEFDKSSYFPIETELDLPQEWLSEMEIRQAYSIPIGEYKMVKLGDIIKIIFNLKSAIY